MLFKKLYNLGDKLEDKIRGKLSHYPIIYAFIGGAGIIIFWRGIWHSIDFLVDFIVTNGQPAAVWWDGPFSIFLGATLLLLVGLFVTSFIGNEIIISGIKGDKRIAEKTEIEIKQDILLDIKMQDQISEIAKSLAAVRKCIEDKINKK